MITWFLPVGLADLGRNGFAVLDVALLDICKASARGTVRLILFTQYLRGLLTGHCLWVTNVLQMYLYSKLSFNRQTLAPL